jgi:hypothetical protein
LKFGGTSNKSSVALFRALKWLSVAGASPVATGLAIRDQLWETVLMAKVLKVGNTVARRGSLVAYAVTGINQTKKTADIKSIKGGIVLHRDILWAELEVLDDSQNAACIVRDATEKS